jgi:signal transduction histidine kinase
MDRLIRDLLDITRIEAGRFTLDQGRVRTDEFIREIVAAHTPLVASGKISLHTELARDLPVVSTDRHRLMQVFENLIGNAVKFSDAEGAITIGATPREGDVLFWVKDTGCGIAREDQAHVFDRFWQAHTRAAHDGAGLGLPIVKGIVDAHGGKIWIESEPGRGTTFFFTLPAQASA